MKPHDILSLGFDKTIAAAIIKSYTEIEKNYVLQKWKPSELDAGHFVEAVRRAIDLELKKSYIPFGKQLPHFNDRYLQELERQIGDESYRMLIPRALKSIYNIRSKRGVAHISAVNPNEMDATYILYTVKWVLAELIRLKSGLSMEKTQAILDKIVERNSPIIWKEDNITWVLNSRMKAREQILALLYDKSPRTDSELRKITEYKNFSNFKKILFALHKEKLVHYQNNEGICRLAPPGIKIAESIFAEYKNG